MVTTSVDEYISHHPKDIQQRLRQLRKTIQQAAPNCTETLNYGIPTYQQNGNLIHYAAYKNHIGLYPTPTAIEAFKDQLSDYTISKGAIQIAHNQTLPLELIQKIVVFRVQENQNSTATSDKP